MTRPLPVTEYESDARAHLVDDAIDFMRLMQSQGIKLLAGDMDCDGRTEWTLRFWAEAGEAGAKAQALGAKIHLQWSKRRARG